MNILILDANTRQAIEILYSLRKSIDPKLNIYVAGQRCKNYYTNYVFFSRKANIRLIYPDPMVNEKSFLKWLLKVIKKFNIDLVIPVLEKTMYLISMIKKDLEEQGVIVPIPDKEQLEIVMYKDKLLKIASKLHIPIPKTIIVKDLKDLNSLSKRLRYPVVIKFRHEIGVSPPRYTIAYNEADLLSKYLKMHKKQSYPIIQEYISGFGIGTFYIFNKYGEPIMLFGHKRILEIPISGGPSVIAEPYLNKNAFSYGIKLLSSIKWKGVAMVEFRYSIEQSKPVLMEVNPRFWGSLPLAIECGINFPYLLIKCYTKPYSECREIINDMQLKYSIMLYLGLLIRDLKTIKEINDLRKYLNAMGYLIKNAMYVKLVEFHDIEAYLAMYIYPYLSRMPRVFSGRIE